MTDASGSGFPTDDAPARPTDVALGATTSAAAPAGTRGISTLIGELAPALATLEGQHGALHARAVRVVGIAVGLVGSVLVGGLVGVFGSIWPLFVGAALAIAFAGWWLAMHERIAAYRDGFKRDVVGRLVAHRYPGATFDAFGGIHIDAFRASRLFRKDIDRYQAEDLIEGRLGATAVRISEVHAEYKTTTTDAKGHTDTQWHTIFRGLFCIADFHKHFQGVTLVVPDGAEGLFGDFGKRLQSLGRTFSDAKLVSLEDPEFERDFAVYGTDQVEARYILSTSLMRRLLDFRQRLNTRVHLAFVDEQVFVAVASNTNHFEPPSIWASDATIDEADVASYLEQVGLAEDVVDSLNLNTRIWSKA